MVFFRNQEIKIFFIKLKLCSFWSSYYVVFLYHWCVFVKGIGIEGNFMKFKRIVDESLNEIKIIRKVDGLRIKLILIFEEIKRRIDLLINVHFGRISILLDVLFFYYKTLIFY